MSTKFCYGCTQVFTSDARNAVFCNKCHAQRKNDICELIISDGTITIFDQNNIQDLPVIIGKKNINVRLDLHGVLDTLSTDVEFEGADTICSISYVGSTTNTRIQARQEMLKRLNHQINFGILVFLRGKGTNKNKFVDVGSKAWINSLIPIDIEKRAIFIDDSEDHYKSTKSMNIENLDTHLFKKKGNNLYKLINQYNALNV